MAKKQGEQSPNSAPSNVATLPARCPVEKCGKKITRMSFCDTHYTWFKEGLISRDGSKPKDFDKKYQDFLKRNKTAA